MRTCLIRAGKALLALAPALLLLACSATPVLHEFPAPLAPSARPPAAVSYSLRQTDSHNGRWVLRGEQGDLIGDFRWQTAFRDALPEAQDRSEDFRRDDRFQDGINSNDYVFRLGATSDSLSASAGWGTAPPRVTVFDAASGERVGELELRRSFDLRFEGVWRGRSLFWRAEPVPAQSVERDTGEGKVEDHFPAAQLLQWTGGSDAGLTVFAGREIVEGQTPEFGEALFDLAARRPLTRRELGDAVVLLFAIRSLQQAAGAAQVLREEE